MLRRAISPGAQRINNPLYLPTANTTQTRRQQNSYVFSREFKLSVPADPFDLPARPCEEESEINKIKKDKRKRE
jgi:hypothetical protein